MANLAKLTEEVAAKLHEEIEAVVLGKHDRTRFGDEDKAPKFTVLTWAEGRPWLDEEYDSGYGGADCRAFHAYTKNWVIFVGEYDGATSLDRIPRNPTAGTEPYFGGTWTLSLNKKDAA